MKVGEKYRVTGLRPDGEEYSVTGIIKYIFAADEIPNEIFIKLYYNITEENESVLASVNKCHHVDRIVLETGPNRYFVVPKLSTQIWRKVYEDKRSHKKKDTQIKEGRELDTKSVS